MVQSMKILPKTEKVVIGGGGDGGGTEKGGCAEGQQSDGKKSEVIMSLEGLSDVF